MKTIHKYLYVIISTCFCVLVAILLSTLEESLPPTFYIRSQYGNVAEDLSIFDAADGNYYVFLPSYATMDRLTITLSSNHEYYLDNTHLSTDMTFENFNTNTPYSFKIDDRQVATLWFSQSSNIATMYVDTVSKSMESIHNNKAHTEYASITLYTPIGHVDFFDMAATIGGRGSSSWLLSKKPYNISLSESSELLNMGSSQKWTLLANAYDNSHLRNKLIYDFADKLATTPAWSPDASFVDLYLNGEYAGLYLLCQKIDAGIHHLNLGKKDFFFELTYPVRISDPATAFDICEVRSIDIISPDNCDEEQKNFLQQYISAFQKSLRSDIDTNHASNALSWDTYIDMESWARKYLIEEVFSNFDSGQASQFFWYDATSQKIFAGPCWDYDISIGQGWQTTWYTPNCMLSQRNWQNDTSWFYALCQKDEFMDLVIEIYVSEFRPLLQEYINHAIQTTASDIEQAVVCETLRWSNLYADNPPDTTVKQLIGYLKDRVVFLDSLWIDQIPHCTITFQTYETYNLCVPVGTVCTSLPQPEDFNATGVWYLSGSTVPFDETQPITEDITLTIQIPTTENDIPHPIISQGHSMREYITLLSIAAIAFLLLCFMSIDFFRHYSNRRNAHERT